MDKQKVLKLINELIERHEIRAAFGSEYYHNGAVDALNELKEELDNIQ